MAGPAGNQHCANCIGTLSFPIVRSRKRFLPQRGCHLKLIHNNATPDSTKLSCLCRVHWGAN